MKEKIIKIGIQMKNTEGEHYIKSCSYILPEDYAPYEALFHCFVRNMKLQPILDAYFVIDSRNISMDHTVSNLAANALSYVASFN
jgi:hypothetical protein